MLQLGLFDYAVEVAGPVRTDEPMESAITVPTISAEPMRTARRKASRSTDAHSTLVKNEGCEPSAGAGPAANSTDGNEVSDELLGRLLIDAALAPTFAQRTLMAHLAGVRQAGGLLPRGGLGYCEHVILNQAGIPFEFFAFDGGLRAMLASYGPKFELTAHQLDRRELGDGGQTITAVIRAALDEMERLKIPILRLHAGRDLASLQWFADYLGGPRALICNNGALQNELRARLRAGTLVLGGVFADTRKVCKARRRVLRAMLESVFKEHLAGPTAVQSHPERSDKIWFEPIFDRAGIVDPHERDMMSFDAKTRVRLTQVIGTVGMVPEGTLQARGNEVTYGQLLDRTGSGIALVREDYRTRKPHLEPGCAKEDAYVANEISYLNRMRNRHGRTLDDKVEADFEPGRFEELRAAGLTQSVAGNKVYEESLERWRLAAGRLKTAGQFPATFCGAFAAAMHASGIEASDLATRIGAPPKLMYAWRTNRAMPTFETEHFVPLAATAMGVPIETFTSRLGETHGGNAVKGRKTLTLSCGKVVRLSGLWRFLPRGAARWPDDKLRPEVESVLERHFRKETTASVRISAGQRNAYELPPEDPTCRIWWEWADLLRFKQGFGDDDRVQLADDNWNSVATIRGNRNIVSGFSRWCLLSPEKGGLGLEPCEVSLRLVLSPQVIKRYLVWRITRSAKFTVDGKPIGNLIASTEKGIAGFFAMLTEADFGWLTQSEEQLGLPEPVPKTFRTPYLRITKTDVFVVEDEDKPPTEVFSAKLVAAIAADWKAAVRDSRRHLRVLKSNFSLKFKLIRDPKDAIEPIVRHASPIAVVLRMVREALKRVRPLETSAYRHAKDYERIVAVLMLVLVVFRSSTLSSLTWTPQNTGALRYVDGRMKMNGKGEQQWVSAHYEVVVDPNKFKNCVTEFLFGPRWNRHDYERDLKDWGGLDGILDHYLKVCRPILLGSRTSDLLFPPPNRYKRPDYKGWEEGDFNYLINTFTAMWCVYNKRTGTGMPGVQRFGPHPFRDIVATHILLHWPDEERWALASRVLGTGERQVRLRYGWINTRAELGKVDGILDEASALAASDIPLW